MEIVRHIKERIKYGESPTSWEAMKRQLIERRSVGLNVATAPQYFYVGNGLVDAFQEMLPVRNGQIDTTVSSNAAQIALNGLEVARGLVLDATGTKLLVQARNDGKTQYELGGSSVTRTRKDREIGDIHTHPHDSSDGKTMPTSTDIVSYLADGDIINFIVTPLRVIALIRTTETPTFADKGRASVPLAKGFMEAMGRRKGKIFELFDMGDSEFFFAQFISRYPHTDCEPVWTLDYADLEELHILEYETARRDTVFKRQRKS